MKEDKFLKNLTKEKVLDKEKIKNNILSSKKVKSKNNIFSKRAFVSAVVSFAIVFSGFVFAASIYTPTNKNYASAQETTEYTQLYDVINNYKNTENAFNLNEFFETAFDRTFTTLETVDMATDDSNNYTKTNVQTDGLDEGDIVKTDGQYIYKLTDNGVYIVSATNGNLQIISSIYVENYVPKELYVSGNKLVMIGGVYEYFYSPYYSIEPMIDCMAYIGYSKTDIRIYDITNKQTPSLERQLTIDGSFQTSRLKIEDNKLFYMINYNFYSGNQDEYVPKITDSIQNDGQETLIPAQNIYFYNDLVSYTYLIFGQIDLDDSQTSDIKAYLGLGGTIYASLDNIYVSSYDYMSIYVENAFGWVRQTQVSGKTRIVKIDINTLTQSAIGIVEGRVDDRYWMDEHLGNLRVATHTNIWSGLSYNNVFVLDENLQTLGKITNIAPGESIYSVRFNGETASLVTFAKIDPYFNLDLSSPTNPTISKGLKEDGVSYYIHYIEDSDFTIGIGRMSNVVQESLGERVVWTGLKVSLYDNSSGEAVNVKTVVLEGSCWSELFYNQKAFMYDEANSVFAFAYENWTYTQDYYYNSMQQGLAVFSFDINAVENNDKLTYQRTLTNVGDINPYDNSSEYSYYDFYRSFIQRGIVINNHIYTISNNVIKSYTLQDLVEFDFVELSQINEEQ